jgi:8-oxo-dGTP diphosphatase
MKKTINSVGFILLKNNKVLLEKRSPNKRVDPNKVCIPSGGIKINESPEDALIRECKEEFGIQLTEYFFIDKLLYNHKKVDFLINYFVVTAWEGKIKRLEAEKLIWINRKDYKKLDLRVDRKALKKINPLKHKKILVIIKSEKNNYLLLRTNKRFMKVDNWYLISGGLDKGETYEEACRREIREETGLKTTNTKSTNKYFEFEWPKKSNLFHKERLMFAMVKEKKPKLSVEHIDYKWLFKNEFIKKIDWYSDKKYLEKIISSFEKQQNAQMIKIILENYSIGQYCAHKRLKKALENTVYLIKTSKGKFVIKIFEDTKIGAIKNQTKIQEYLSSKNNPVPKIVLSKSGKDIVYYNKKPVQIQEFVNGKRVRLTNDLIGQYGKVIGKIDSYLKELKLTDFYPWGKEFEFKQMKIFPCKKIDLKKEHKKLLKEIKKLDKNKLSKSIVHGDLNLDNTLIYNGKINAIIDFGDSHTGFTVTDPMIFICDEIITQKSLNYAKIKLFLREYEKYIKLNNEDKKAMFLFAKLRCLYSMNWCNQMAKKHGQNNRTKCLFKEYYNKYSLISNINIFGFFGKL